MTSPLSAYGSSQPTITQTFQPGQNVEARQQQAQRQQNNEVAPSQPTQAPQQSSAIISSSSADLSTTEVASEGRRGGLVDITV